MFRTIRALIIGFAIAAVFSAVSVGAAEEMEEVGKLLLKLQAEKGDVYEYNVRAELTYETRQGIREELIRKVEDVLDMEYSQTCKVVESDGTMGFQASYGDYKLVRTITEGENNRKEVYTVEGLTIYDEKGLSLKRKWSEMPRSEQAEVRKVFAREYGFAANPNCEIKELFECKVIEHELPGFHALRLQQAVYYPGFRIGEGTVWSWNQPIKVPKLRSHPLSGKVIPAEREYELIGLREVEGKECVTISVEGNLDLNNIDEKLSFTRKLVEKAHIEKATGMAVLVEGTLESELQSADSGARMKNSVEGTFTISRMIQEPDETE